MKIALVYDCLYPNTVGGAERWYRKLAERLTREGHDVTYLTRRQWGSEGAQTDFETIAVSGAGPLYVASGRRRIGPPLKFGWGVFWHMLRHGRSYDAVHTDAFPYFSLIGAWLALRLRGGRSRPAIIVDWFELWTRGYWTGYVGGVAGRIGYAVQRLCAKLPDRSFVFSQLHAQRLAAEGHRAPVRRLTGIFEPEGAGDDDRPPLDPPDPPRVVFAGRHIPEKQVGTIPPAIDAARRQIPRLRCTILGDGPDTESVRELVRQLDLGDAIELPGRVAFAQVQDAIRAASCLVLPSSREGYGLVVVEAVSQGTPAVVVAGPDNAATELVHEHVNGSVALSSEPQVLADAIVRTVEAGAELRRKTFEWYRSHRHELSLAGSLDAVAAAYASAPRAKSHARR